MKGLGKIGLWLAWLAGLALLAAGLAARLEVSSDLRSFMPPPETAQQELLLEGIGEGPGSRLLILAIDGADPEQLANLSSGLAAQLADDPLFTQVLNGTMDLAALESSWLPYRYLLSATLDSQAFDAAWLHAELLARLRDLGSPAADMLESILPRDPTLEILALAERWKPRRTPPIRNGVWLADCAARNAGCSGFRALLLVQTASGGFDPGAQAQALQALRGHFAALAASDHATLTISGPGFFSVEVSQRTRAESHRFALIGSLGFVLMLLFAYRSLTSLALVAMPVLTAAVAGASALALVFGHAHGITLAFGFTLLGVVQEYPIRVLSHRRKDLNPIAGVRALWPLLATAIVSAAIAYLAFLASGVEGLQQLAVFTISGLLAAGLATRYLLPRILPARFRDAADTPGIRPLWQAIAALPRPRWLPFAVLLLAFGLLLSARTPLWENNLAALAPVPKPLLTRDAELRAALGVPDMRYLLVLQASDADGVLALSANLEAPARRLVEQGAVEDIELPSRYLPPAATQLARQAKLPTRAELEAMLEQALAGLPFREGLFVPFVADVERARALPPLDAQAFAALPVGQRLDAMLLDRGDHWLGLASLRGVEDLAAIRALADIAPNHVTVLDLKAASESLVIAYRERILWALGIAFVLLAATVVLAFRNLRRGWHVLAPMTLATLLVIAVERGMGISLSLFHLVAITLAAGLGLHYALFFERRLADEAEARRTLHATLVCVLSALLVFGLLAMSSIPVLRAIGLTVSLGVAFHFCLSLIMARPRETGDVAED